MRSPIAVATVALTVFVLFDAFGQEEEKASTQLPDKEVVRGYFTDSKLLTQEGEEVRFFTDVLEDRVVVINGFYTHCEGLSPRQSQVLSGLQEMLGESLGKDVFIVSITVDPKRDTVEKIGEYAKRYEAQSGWIFLTGKPKNVDWVNHKIGQYKENPEEHSGIYILGNVRTGLWKKVPLHAMSRDLYREVQLLLRDEGEPARE